MPGDPTSRSSAWRTAPTARGTWFFPQGYIFAKSGDTRRAFTYLGLGDTANALFALERATDGKEIWPSVANVTDPMYDAIRGTARFEALLRRVGLAP